MERGLYFDAWIKHNHCYHPSLPLRSLQMLEELKAYHATTLVWAGLGGGSISLPYLEHEAWGDVDPRMRFYGYMNDSEFIRLCNENGIKLFGIVFEVQGWEFPAVFDQDGKLIRFNLAAQLEENHDWYGLREFSQDKYPNAFSKRFSDYFPEGLKNSLGEKVDNLFEECSTRDRFGNPIHAEWVEVKEHKAQAYQMCRNNPVWRQYLKKIMEIQIDAGVAGIQLDECELPMTSIGSGGCFCKDCMREFTQYLRERREAGRLSAEWDGIDLDNFNYKTYLIEHDAPYPDGAPFFREYWEFQVTQVRKYFSELADYAKAYAKEKYGRDLPVSGNFYNLQPAYHPIVPKADIIITEMEHSLFRQPYFYRYSAGFAEGKPVIIAENPYGGIIPELLQLLDKGKGYDLYRIFMLEASVYGCNMSVPYGSWMGNTIKDAFWAPRSVTKKIQDYLFEHEDFFPKAQTKGAVVLYSYGSNCYRDAHRAGDANGDANRSNLEHLSATTTDWGNTSAPMPFWDVIRLLSSKNVMYDVRMMPDGILREDDFTADALRGYPVAVLPDAYELTERQAAILEEYVRDGGKLIVYGRIAEGTPLRETLSKYENVCFCGISGDQKADLDAFSEVFGSVYGPISPVEIEDPRIGVQRYDENGKTVVHILNYDYDASQDRVIPAQKIRIRLRDLSGSKFRLMTLDGESTAFNVTPTQDGAEILLEEVPVYCAVVCE